MVTTIKALEVAKECRNLLVEDVIPLADEIELDELGLECTIMLPYLALTPPPKGSVIAKMLAKGDAFKTFLQYFVVSPTEYLRRKFHLTT